MAVTPEEYARAFDERVARVVSEGARRSVAFAERLRSAGVEPSDITDVGALDRIPVLTKDDIAEQQTKEPPFGGLLAADAKPRRIFQSPGPIYEPEEARSDPWRWAPALEAAGFEPDDVVLNAFSYHLSPAGAMFEEAAVALGCTLVPGGIGNIELQARACRDLGVTAYIGLPSYLNSLLDRGDEIGMNASSWPLDKAFVTAEPLPPSLRDKIQQHLSIVRQGYGTAETGNLGYECERVEGFHVPIDALVEVCDLTTGEALWAGEEGQVVATLFGTDYPLVRLATGDLSKFLTEPCSCGIGSPRIAGWLGRVGEAVKVRGMFLHPRQVQTVMAEVEGVARYRFIIGREEHKDVLRCEIVPEGGADRDAVASAVKDKVRSALRFSIGVQVVDRIDEQEDHVVDTRSWE